VESGTTTTEMKVKEKSLRLNKKLRFKDFIYFMVILTKELIASKIYFTTIDD